mgnify:FL=1
MNRAGRPATASVRPDSAIPLDSDVHVDLLRQLAGTSTGALVTCASGSMEPAIRAGEQVRIATRPPRQGDIALFVSTAGRLILHRLLLRVPWTPLWLQTGDASRGAPRLVHERRIIGVRVRG